MTEWIPSTSHEAISDTFCSSWQLFEVKFTPWKSTGRNTVAYFQYTSKLIKYRWQYIIYNEQINYRLQFLSRFSESFRLFEAKFFPRIYIEGKFSKEIGKERDRMCLPKQNSSFFHLVV